MLGWICAVHRRMLHTLRGAGFECLWTLFSIKMEHPWPLQVCTMVCIIQYMMHTGAGVIRIGGGGIFFPKFSSRLSFAMSPTPAPRHPRFHVAAVECRCYYCCWCCCKPVCCCCCRSCCSFWWEFLGIGRNKQSCGQKIHLFTRHFSLFSRSYYYFWRPTHFWELFSLKWEKIVLCNLCFHKKKYLTLVLVIKYRSVHPMFFFLIMS